MAKVSDSEKLYYTISEVATLIGVPATTIRFWEREFPQIQPVKNRHGDRRYKAENIEKLRQIQKLKKEGLTTQGVKDYLNSRRSTKRQSVIDKLEGVKSFLEGMKSWLTAQQEEAIESKLEESLAQPLPPKPIINSTQGKLIP